MAGDDANPAIPGYDPDISAELYTTNGETTEHAHDAYGTLAFTPGDGDLRRPPAPSTPTTPSSPTDCDERSSTSRTPRS